MVRRPSEESLEEIETYVRQKRRELTRESLAILVDGPDSGHAPEGQRCRQRGGVMAYKSEGFVKTIHGLKEDTRLGRACYVCPKCAGETPFLPDETLKLRRQSWNGRVARVMTRCLLCEPSFEQAAEGYQEATGGEISGASQRRVTQGFEREIRARQTHEAD